MCVCDRMCFDQCVRVCVCDKRWLDQCVREYINSNKVRFINSSVTFFLLVSVGVVCVCVYRREYLLYF